MLEVKREDLKEGECYLIEMTDDENTRIEVKQLMTSNPKRRTNTRRYSTLIKILKIEEPYIVFSNLYYCSDKNFDIFENCKFLQPSAEFLKALKPKRNDDDDFC